MTSPLEAAAERLEFFSDCVWDEPTEVLTDVLRAYMRAAIGCPKCGGTGKWNSWEHGEAHDCDDGFGRGVIDCIEGFHRCPAEHVKIVFLGETIYADPDKCEWYCGKTRVLGEGMCQGAMELVGDQPWYKDAYAQFKDKPVGYHSGDYDADEELAARRKYGCGWQPKWSAIKGDET